MKKRISENEHRISVLESEIFNAIRHCQYTQLALYIRHKYNLNITSKDGRNGLFYALDIDDSYKRCRMIKFCLSHRINPLQKDNINGYTVLQEAIARQQFDSFQILLADAGGEMDWQSLDTRGRTILHQAVESNNISVLENLITVMNRYSISVDLSDKNGLTPYLLAKKLHRHDMAEILLKKGHASQQKCDTQTHRTAQEWECIGLKENNLSLRQSLQQEINDAMRNGKINKANKLKKAFSSKTSLLKNQDIGRNSYVTTATQSYLNGKSSSSADEVSEGDQSESFINSRTDKNTSYSEHNVPTYLPPITTTTLRRHRQISSYQSLLDLFQIT